jgi:acyl phosphate:glycerol-3-phosphate acyltransferase
MIPSLLTAVFSYLLGSIPFGYILMRVFRGQDIRQSGSGNIGATNVSRSSPALGIVTLLLDAAKGWLAVYLTLLFFRGPDEAARNYLLMALAGLFAVIGHCFPVWLGFRGGKGVATAVGSFLMISPAAVLGAIVVFLVIALSTRYISLASIIAAASFPAFAAALNQGYYGPLTILIMCTTSAVVIIRHRQNIGRLLSHTEPRFHLRRG